MLMLSCSPLHSFCVDISWYRCAAQLEQILKKIQGKKERKKERKKDVVERNKIGTSLNAETQGPRLGVQRLTVEVSPHTMYNNHEYHHGTVPSFDEKVP
jgi:hypothetical protein